MAKVLIVDDEIYVCELNNPDFFFESIHKYLDYATDVSELKQVMLQHIGDVLQQNLDLRNKRGADGALECRARNITSC